MSDKSQNGNGAKDSIIATYESIKNLHASLLKQRSRFEKGKADPMIKQTWERFKASERELEAIKTEMKEARKRMLENHAALDALFDETELERQIAASTEELRKFKEANAVIIYGDANKKNKAEDNGAEIVDASKLAENIETVLAQDGETAAKELPDITAADSSEAVRAAMTSTEGFAKTLEDIAFTGASDAELRKVITEALGVEGGTSIPSGHAIRYAGGNKPFVSIGEKDSQNYQRIAGPRLLGAVRDVFRIGQPDGLPAEEAAQVEALTEENEPVEPPKKQRTQRRVKDAAQPVA